MKHIFHSIFVFFVGLFGNFDEIVDLVTVLLIPLKNGFEALIYFFGDFGLLLNSLELNHHDFNSLDGLFIVLELVMV